MGRRSSAPAKKPSKPQQKPSGNQIAQGSGDGVYHNAGFLKKSGGG